MGKLALMLKFRVSTISGGPTRIKDEPKGFQGTWVCLLNGLFTVKDRSKSHPLKKNKKVEMKVIVSMSLKYIV